MSEKRADEKKVLLLLHDDDLKIQKGFQTFADQNDMNYTFRSVGGFFELKGLLNRGEVWDALIVQYQVSTRPFRAAEFVSLKETYEQLIIVVIIPDDLIGGDYCRELLTGNIHCAIADKDAGARNLFKLIENPRQKSKARIYYNLARDIEIPSVAGKGIVNAKKIEDARMFLLHPTDPADDKLTLEERLDIINKSCTSEEMTQLFAKLTESEKAPIRTLPGYKDYFLTTTSKIVKPMSPVSITEKYRGGVNKVVSLVQGAKDLYGAVKQGLAEKSGAVYSKDEQGRQVITRTITEQVIETQYVTRRVIGVLGLYQGAGANELSLALAKTIAEDEPVTFIEGSGQDTFEKFDFETLMGPNFVSVPHLVEDEEPDFSQVNNMYEGINFFVANPAYEPVVMNVARMVEMVNGTNGNVVISLGDDMNSSRVSGYLNILSHLVIVYEANKEDRFLSEIKFVAESLKNASEKVAFIRICHDRRFQSANEINQTPAFSAREIPEMVNGIPNLWFISKDEQDRFRDYLEITGSGKTNLEKAIAAARRATLTSTGRPSGITEIAIIGAASRCGTTHTAFMMADSVRKESHVAIFESNQSGQMQRLATECGHKAGIFNIQGIDVFYGMNYAEFAQKYRSKYNYVIIDFGNLADQIPERSLFNLCKRRYICADASLWNTKLLVKAMKLAAIIDPYEDAVMLFPCKTRAMLRRADVKTRVGRRKLCTIPCCEEPVGMGTKVTSYMRKFLEC